jgi:hypothetical protein
MDEHDMIRWTAFQLNILVCREIGRVVNVKKENVELQWRQTGQWRESTSARYPYKLTAD